ncbi:MAG TPA: M13 family metallopeptidase [Candidatus Polarisedimenticolia bacterium]|jgi:endothelin-converting enzyme/putative endopeptidase|nr:M13 family metallopeptidase [Candidatus Polarisedimenticolia bacterium]
MMRTLATVLVLVFGAGAAAFASSEPQHGVYAEDLNRSVDPCSDFFEYANGAWRAANPIPASMTRWSRRWASGESAKEQLRGILDEASQKKGLKKGAVEQQIADYYASCMDEPRIEQAGIAPIRPLLSEIDAMKGPADLQRMIGRFQTLQIPVPFGVRSASDNHDPGRVIADVYAAGLGLPDRDYYFKPEPRFQEAREKYQAHVAAMFHLSGTEEAAAQAAAQTVFEFEKKLAAASLDNVALRDPRETDHKMTFVALEHLASHFDWSGFFRSAALPKSDLNVQEPKFVQEVERRLTASPLPEWKTYLKWQLLHSAAGALSTPFVNEDFAFYGKYLAGAGELKPRWKRCVESTDADLGEALGQKYVERHFPPAAKARMQELVKNLLLAMRETIEHLEWMGADTKKKALEKISTFNPKIGYPDKWKDYRKVEIRRDSFWANTAAGRKFNVADDWAQVGKPVDRGRWGMTPPTSNAYYNPLLNEIVFPAGILQPPAFRMDAADAVNYGAIGVVIGHEISHGFDDQGAQYDAQGRLQNWWTAEDLRGFQARTACVVNQFDGYFIEPEIHHNGKLVLGEAIGDLAGAKIAYRAYQISQQGKPPAPPVDGLTPDQQFFVAWGQFRGDEIRPETQRMMIQGDPHPIAKYRVIGPLSNLADFQRAFGCAADAPMVRPAASRCEVW